jgi:xylitol oxidase
MTSHPTNWAGNITFSTARVHRPTTVEEVQEIVRRSEQVRVLGSRHSFNDLADSTGDLISLENLVPTWHYDADARTATVNGSATYGQVCAWLHGEGAALHNMASLPHITIAGAIATATHGSGDSNGNLATAVAGLEIVNGDGEVVKLTRAGSPAEFAGAVVGLGGLGVVTKVTLETVPTYLMQQEVYENLPLAKLLAHFDEISSHAYSVSLFTDWQQSRVNSVWIKRHLPDGAARVLAPSFFEATVAPVDRHPVVTLAAAPCTPQMGLVGPWHERLPHFRLDHVPSVGHELQTEYFVPRRNAVAAIEALVSINDQIAPNLKISEVRTVAADSLWMSTAYGQATVGLHFTWKQEWEAVQKLLPVMEARLMPLEARPHWGKLFSLPPAYVQARYPKLAEFRDLLRKYDPAGKFRNQYLDTYIFGE